MFKKEQELKKEYTEALEAYSRHLHSFKNLDSSIKHISENLKAVKVETVESWYLLNSIQDKRLDEILRSRDLGFCSIAHNEENPQYPLSALGVFPLWRGKTLYSMEKKMLLSLCPKHLPQNHEEEFKLFDQEGASVPIIRDYPSKLFLLFGLDPLPPFPSL